MRIFLQAMRHDTAFERQPKTTPFFGLGYFLEFCQTV
jgi:hypothetical protein